VLIRRAVIDPLWLPAAAVLMVLLAVVAALAGLAWPLTRRGRLLRVTLFAMLYLLADTCLLVGAAIIWLRWPTAARRDDERWNGAHARLLSRALALLLASARPLFGFRVELEEPPDASQLPDRPLLVLARHGGPGDSFTLVELLLTRYGRQPRIVMKESLQWDPGLDVVLSRLRCCFLPSRTGAGEDLPAAWLRQPAICAAATRCSSFPRAGTGHRAATAGRSPGCAAAVTAGPRRMRTVIRTSCRPGQPACWPALPRGRIWTSS
jgi:hypothetical protein